MVHTVSDAGARKKLSLLRRAEVFGLTLLLLCVAGIAWSGWYYGKASPDLSTDSELRVLTPQMRDSTSLAADPDRARIRAAKLAPVATLWLWAGTLRTFAVYHSAQAPASDDIAAAIAVGFDDLKKWERRRGYVLSLSEQPAQIGTMLFVESAPRYFEQVGWTHVAHAYDQGRLFLAVVLGCSTLVAYGIIRLVILLLAAAYAFIATGAVPPWAVRFDEASAAAKSAEFR